ncbi:MAG: O-antigen ligase family protein, partial [Hyphomicrobiales bacterium]|nr:O-antigen ligase family protein [Hyphomicrobiales bacterium]
LPAVAVFLATAQLDFESRRSLSIVFVGMAILSVPLGLAQLAQGPDSGLRFFPVTNFSESVGFFANRNHYAALLYAQIPIVAAWIISLASDRKGTNWLVVAAFALAIALLILGVGMSRSRAGILLATVAVLSSLGMLAASRQRLARYGSFLLLGAWLLGAILVVQYAFSGLVDRLDDSLLADLRIDIARVTIDAAAAFQPVGTGFGTFEAVYRIAEPTDLLRQKYINHAHNDWLELWMEGGWVTVILLALFLAWFGRRSYQLWRRQASGEEGLDLALQRAATISISIILLHSAVDYPLRTTAMMTFFGWSCALMILPMSSRGSAKPGDRQERTGHRRRPSSRSTRRRTFKRGWG